MRWTISPTKNARSVRTCAAGWTGRCESGRQPGLMEGGPLRQVGVGKTGERLLRLLELALGLVGVSERLGREGAQGMPASGGFQVIVERGLRSRGIVGVQLVEADLRERRL